MFYSNFVSMKNVLTTFILSFITIIVNGQFRNSEKFPQNNLISGKGGMAEVSNPKAFSPNFFGKKENRFLSILGGYASAEGESGINFELARGFQPKGFGFGAYTSFVRIPKVNYSNWTITGLQLRASAVNGEIKPYGIFDFGMFNLSYSNEKVTFRTGTVGLGGGLEKSMGDKSFLLDFRWKSFFDYKGERDAFTMWTVNAGIKF
jgi:hypothetical protein